MDIQFSILPVDPARGTKPHVTGTDHAKDVALPARLRHLVRPIAAMIALCAVLASAVSPVLAAPSSTTKTPAVKIKPAAPAPVVRVDVLGASVTPTGTLAFNVTTQLPAAVTDLSIKTKVLTPSGAVLFQRTETRGALPAGSYAFAFSKLLGPAAVREGRYRVQVQVKAGAAAVVDVTANALVVAPGKHTPVPLAVVVRVGRTPGMTPDGSFVTDPSIEATARADVRAFARLAASRRDLALSLAISPLLLEEWKTASEGAGSLTTSGTASGTASSARDSTAPRDCAATIDALASAVTSGSVPMLDVPYAEPDLIGLAGIGAVGDLRDQLDLGTNTYQVTLHSQPGTGTALTSDGLPAAALAVLGERHVGFVLVRPAALRRSGIATVTPGVYHLKESTATATAVAIDDRASRLIQDPTASTDRIADAIFDRLDAKGAKGQPVVVVVDSGPGATCTTAHLSATLDALAASGWIRLTSVAAAATLPAIGEAAASGEESGVSAAPAGWWADVAAARDNAAALAAAAGPQDPDARRAAKDTLIAESRLWAGADGMWREAERGRAFAAAPVEIAKKLLGTLKVSGSPVTLSGTTGKVPVNIHNGTDRILNVVLTASAPRVVVPDGGRVSATLRPGDNYVTVPVDMGSTFVAQLRVGVTAGPLELSAATVRVRASYVDRLVLVGLVVLVLLGLLLYIRSRTRIATMSVERSSARADARATARRERAGTPKGARRRPE